tara:strand:+ start:893 stop:1795 length:903 start_codon:yes stop_codon:yes gene_type:complete
MTLLNNTNNQLHDYILHFKEFLGPYRYFVYAIIIIVVMVIAARITREAIKRQFEKSDHLGTSNQTNYQFLRNGISFVFFILGVLLIFYTIPGLKQLGLTLFAGAGIFAAIIGFASQAAFANIVGGIFIVIFKPFRVGDVLKVGSTNWGTVEDITLRHTVIRSFQNERYIIPNSSINSDTILNASIGEQKTCIFLEMGISYDSDIDLAMKIMVEEAEKHPKLIDNRSPEDIEAGTPKVVTRVIGFGDSSVNLRAYTWASDPIAGFVMKTDLYKSIKMRFDEEGIEIPFPYRTIVYKNEKQA